MTNNNLLCSSFVSYDFGESISNFIDVSLKQRNYICRYSKDALDNQKAFFKDVDLNKYFENRIMVAGNANIAVKEIDSLKFAGYTKEVSNCNGYAGIYTSMLNVPLIAGIGDCPWLMVVGESNIGMIHVGRNILDNYIIQLFFEDFSKKEDISKVKIGFSPYIHNSHFPHNTIDFNRKNEWTNAILNLDDYYLLDLERIIMNDLKEVGILEKNIQNFMIDTYEMSKISSLIGGFEISHRQASEKEGRSLICLMKKEI